LRHHSESEEHERQALGRCGRWSPYPPIGWRDRSGRLHGGARPRDRAECCGSRMPRFPAQKLRVT
jgi:hypothetical protein